MSLVVMLLSNDGVSDPRVEKEADALSSAGWEVVLLAWDRAGKAPVAEKRGAWRVERLGPRAVHGGGARNLPAYRAFWRAAAARTAELAPHVIHCHDLDTAPAGLSALRALGDRPRLVLDFHEMYRFSRMVPRRGLLGAVARAAVRRVERRAIPRADAVLTVSPGQVDYYRSLGAREVVLVENAPDLELFAPVNRHAEEFTVCFIGQKRYVPGLTALIDAVQRHSELRALLVGGGPAEADVAAAAEGAERVEAAGRVNYAEIPALYQRCDAVWAVYDISLENWRTAFPVKVMEGMASALPVVVSKGSWVAEYVAENGLGIAVDDRDAAGVEAALIGLAADRDAAHSMGQRGRELAEREINWHASSTRLLATYANLEGPK